MTDGPEGGRAPGAGEKGVPVPAGAGAERVSRFLGDLGKAYQALAMYGGSHPALAGRLEAVRDEAARIAAEEPGRRLLLGVARDRFLYRDAFLPSTLRSTASLAEALYLRQVATLSLSPSLSPEGLALLFRSLREGGEEGGGEAPEECLARAGARGIRVSPLNYKEILARDVADGEDAPPPPAGGSRGREREEALWRMLLTADVSGGEGEEGVARELSETPGLVSLVVARARRSAALGGGGHPAGGDGEGGPSPELLRRVFRRLGDTMESLGPERRSEILSSLEEGIGDAEGLPPLPAGVAEAIRAGLAEDRSDGEVLDLLGSVLALEEKGGRRLKRVFDLLSDARTGESLLAAVPDRVRESLRAKDYYAVRTWETLEKLLLRRTEERYIAGDHGAFLEAVSGEGRPAAPGAEGGDPALAAAFDGDAVRARSGMVLLELLWREQEGAPFAALLEDVRKIVPVLVSRGELSLLSTVLASLDDLRAASEGERARALEATIATTDFGLLVDAYLAMHDAVPEEESVRAVLARFVPMAGPSLLGRLLVEDDASRRRRLLDLAVRMGEGLAPFVLERMGHPKWYFVRNLCWILGELGVRRGLAGLFRSLNHEEHRVRREAIAALGKMRAAEAVEPLGKILLNESFLSGGRDDAVRVEAAAALFRIGGAEAVGLIHRGARSRRQPVREQCERLLGTRGRG